MLQSQNSISIYLDNRVLPVSPNECECFLQSLQLVKHIQVIRIDSNSVNLTQFKSLLEIIANSPLSCLALRFFKKDSTKVLAYIDQFKETKLRIETRISIELEECTLTDATTVNILSTAVNTLSTDVNTLSTAVNILSTGVNTLSTAVNILSTGVNRNIAGMKLYGSEYSNQFLQSIANQISALQYLYLKKNSS